MGSLGCLIRMLLHWRVLCLVWVGDSLWITEMGAYGLLEIIVVACDGETDNGHDGGAMERFPG